MVAQLCLPRPLKVQPRTSLARSLPPRPAAALPPRARPPLAPVRLRTIIAGASGPRCRRRNTARRCRALQGLAPLQWPLPRGQRVCGSLRLAVYESSGPLPAPARRPYAAPSVGRVPRYGCGLRCPRIAAVPLRAPAFPPKLPPSRLPAAAASQCLPGERSASPGALPQTPAFSARQARGEQLAPSEVHPGPVSRSPLFSRGIPARSVLSHET